MLDIESKNTYEVTIAGVPLKLKSDHDKNTVDQMVNYVDQKMNEALLNTKSGAMLKASILTSLNIAEDFVLLKKKLDETLSEFEQKAEHLISELENSIYHKE